MTQPATGPGAALVLLRRQATTTDVMLVTPEGAGGPVPCAAPRGDESQRSLLDQLVLACGDGAIDRLYASPVAVSGEGGALGVFVAFAREPAPEPPDGAWTDLREACRTLGPVWAPALAAVRERFVAQPPDEALRIG